jgi:hypothetical protein
VTLTIIWSVALCLTFPIGASLDSPYPVYAAVAAVGAAYIGLSLRRYAVAGPFGVLAWIACAIAVPSLVQWGDATNTVVATATTCVTLAVWVMSFARFAGVPAERDDPSKVRNVTAGGAAFISCLALATGAGLAIGLFAVPGHERFFAVPTDLRRPLTAVVLLSLAVAVLVSILGGFGRAVGGGPQPTTQIPFRWEPGPFEAPRGRRRTTLASARDPFEIIGRALVIFVDSAGVAARFVAAAFAYAVRRVLSWFFNTLVFVLNVVWRWIYHTTMIMVEGFRQSGHALRMSLQVVAVPLASFLIAAYAAFTFARDDLAYLQSGSLPALGMLLVYIAGLFIAMTVAWMALSQQRISTSLRSVGLTIGNFGARLLIATAVGGWAIGLYGVFGGGPFRVGFATYGATVVLALAATYSTVRNRGSSANEAEEVDEVPLVRPSASVRSFTTPSVPRPTGHPVLGVTLVVILAAVSGVGAWLYDRGPVPGAPSSAAELNLAVGPLIVVSVAVSPDWPVGCEPAQPRICLRSAGPEEALLAVGYRLAAGPTSPDPADPQLQQVTVVSGSGATSPLRAITDGDDGRHYLVFVVKKTDVTFGLQWPGATPVNLPLPGASAQPSASPTGA